MSAVLGEAATASDSGVSRQPSLSKAIRNGRLPAGWLFAGLGIFLVILVIVAAGRGAYAINLRGVLAILFNRLGLSNGGYSEQQQAVLLTIRLPRVLMGLFVGAALGTAGATMQGLFRNPLADPGLLGVTGGAALAVAVTIVFGDALWSHKLQFFGLGALPFAAFAGAVATTALVYRIGRTEGGVSVAAMLLAGIALNALSLALIGLSSYLASDEQLRNLTFWSLGSLGNARWPVVGILAGGTGIALAGMWRLRNGLNALALGENEARHLGIPLERLKSLAMIGIALAVGISVAFCGMIGFIGLMAPHCVRLIAGPDARIVLPGSALMGAVITVGADLVARTLVAPAEIPIGVLTALLGAPFFLFLLLGAKQRMVQE